MTRPWHPNYYKYLLKNKLFHQAGLDLSIKTTWLTLGKDYGFGYEINCVIKALQCQRSYLHTKSCLLVGNREQTDNYNIYSQSSAF